MMNSLFETFDPLMSMFNLSLTALLIPIYLIWSTIFLNVSRHFKMMKMMQEGMFNEMFSIINNKNKNNKILIMFALFLIILILNVVSLIPYVYTVTSQMLFTFSMALPLWLSLFLFSVIFNTKHFLSHMVPLSTPLPLSQFMVIIETISLIIRPITLSVRLCANMTAGHILMALCSAPIFMCNPMSLALTCLILLEIAVAFIQSYVFTMLSSMYLSETI